MVFNFYLDPEILVEAASHPPYGLQTLCNVLQGILANGLLFDFEDERSRQEIGRRVGDLPNDFARKRAATLFSALAKRNRILAVMEPDYLSSENDVDQALRCAANHQIQLVLSERTATVAIPRRLEFVGLATYFDSAVERERLRAATTGQTYAGGELNAAAFLKANFANAVRYARRIEISDRLIGERFADNFEYTIGEFFRFLEPILYDPDECEIVFHCGESSRNGHFCHTVGTLRGSRMAALKISANFYGDPAGHHPQPHERYIWTDQFGFLVGRGMDFLDRTSGMNRDVSLDLKDEGEIARIVGAYQPKIVRTEMI